MPWSSGTFSRTDGTRTGTQVWQNARDAAVKIVATDHDTHDQDVADGINSTLHKGGQNEATGDIKFGGNDIVNVGGVSNSAGIAAVRFTYNSAGDNHILFANSDSAVTIQAQNTANDASVPLYIAAGGSAGVHIVSNGETAAIKGAGEIRPNIGKALYPLRASAFVARGTNGAGSATLTTGSNDANYTVFDFDAATSEGAQIEFAMPKSWNEGTVSVKVRYTHATATAYDVLWGVRAGSIGDLDTMDVTWGTAVSISDTSTAANVLAISAESTALTIGGTPAENDSVIFEVYRQASATADTLNVDARFVGLDLFVTFDRGTDD